MALLVYVLFVDLSFLMAFAHRLRIQNILNILSIKPRLQRLQYTLCAVASKF